MSDSKQQVLLAEYQAAQASAEHHDTLTWTITGIVWGATVGFLAFAATNVDREGHPAITLGVCVLGIAFLFYVGLVQKDLRSVKCQKYVRCQEIETLLGMHQHSALEYPEGSQTSAYTWINAILVTCYIVVVSIALSASS